MLQLTAAWASGSREMLGSVSQGQPSTRRFAAQYHTDSRSAGHRSTSDVAALSSRGLAAQSRPCALGSRTRANGLADVLYSPSEYTRVLGPPRVLRSRG